MLSLKAHWRNPPKTTSQEDVLAAEKSYAEWLMMLSQDNLEYLKQSYPTTSRSHWTYQVMNGKALHGIANKNGVPKGVKLKFELEFNEVAP